MFWRVLCMFVYMACGMNVCAAYEDNEFLL